MKIEFDRETFQKARDAYMNNDGDYIIHPADRADWQAMATVFADAANSQLQSAPGISVEELARELRSTRYSENFTSDPSPKMWLKVARRAIELLGPGAGLPTGVKESVKLSTDAADESPSLLDYQQAAIRHRNEAQIQMQRAEAAEAERDKLRERLEKIRRILEMVVQNQHASFRPDTVSFAKELVGLFGYSVVPEQHTPARVVEVGDGEIPSKFLMPGSVAELNARGSVQL
ncbi:MAG TPA: hypothetical protein PLI96_07880 [Halothiobacillus sp.]|nr:hypothetical protein [Halothiobacillus sp.]